MKQFFILSFLLALGVNASRADVAAAQSAATVNEKVLATTVNALLGELRFYEDHNGVDGTDSYLVQLTDAKGGFKMDGTMTEGPGMLLNVLLNGPKAADIYHPVLPTGTYTFNADNSSFTFSDNKESYVLECVDKDGSVSSNKTSIAGGTIVVKLEENGFYNVNATVTTGGISPQEFTFNYNGPLIKTNSCAWLPGTVYEVDAPNLLSGLYDKSTGDYMLTFSGVEFGPDGMINSAGDGLVLMLVRNNSTDFIKDLPGTYTYTSAYNIGSWEDGTYVGGCFLQLSPGYDVPYGTMVCAYDDLGITQYCGIAVGGTITVSNVGTPSDGNIKIEYNLISGNGCHIVGSWEGNMIGKIQDYDGVSGIHEIESGDIPARGLTGRIEAPEGAEVYTFSGIKSGTENLCPGIYIVRSKGRTTKVVVK